MPGQTIDLTRTASREKFIARLKESPALAAALFDNSIEQMLNGSMFPLRAKKDPIEARTERDARIVAWACAAIAIPGISNEQFAQAVELIRLITFNPRLDYMSALKSYSRTETAAWQVHERFDSYYEMPMPNSAEKTVCFAELLREYARHVLEMRETQSDARYALRGVLNMCGRGLIKAAEYPPAASRPYVRILQDAADTEFAHVWEQCSGTIFAKKIEEGAQRALIEMSLAKFEPKMALEIANFIVQRDCLSESLRVRVCEFLAAEGSRQSMDAATLILSAARLEDAPKKILFDFLANVSQEEAIRLRPLVESSKNAWRMQDDYYGDSKARYTSDPQVFEDLERIYINRIFVDPDQEPSIENLSLEDRGVFADMTGEIYKINPTRAFAVAARLLATDFAKPRLTSAQYAGLYDVLLKTYVEYACHENADANLRSTVVGAICSLVIHQQAPISLVRHFADAVADAGMRGISPAVVFYTANKIAQKAEIPLPRRVMMVEALKNLLQHEDAAIRSAAEAGRAQVAAEQLGLAHSSLLPDNFFSEGGGQQALLAKLAPSRFELPLITLPKPAP